MKTMHDFVVKVETLHFNNIASYFSWKAEEETRTHSAYVQQCAPCNKKTLVPQLQQVWCVIKWGKEYKVKDLTKLERDA